MGNEKELLNVSKATIGRLPPITGICRKSSPQGKRPFRPPPSRKICTSTRCRCARTYPPSRGEAGKPKLGFAVADLIADIDRFLGYDNLNDAVLVGVGGLGKALAGYVGFKNYGLNIVAAFDADPARVGTTVGGIKVFPADELARLVRRLNVLIGIVAVPREAAQGVADELIKGGVRAIWNFAPVHLNVPENIAVKNEDMAASLAILSKRLAEILNSEK